MFALPRSLFAFCLSVKAFQESLNRLSIGHIMKDILNAMAGILWIGQVPIDNQCLSDLITSHRIVSISLCIEEVD